MRKLKQITLAVVLITTLATGAMAGISECPPEPPPPPAQPSQSTTGIIESPPSAQTTNDATTDPVIDLTLTVLQTLLSVF